MPVDAKGLWAAEVERTAINIAREPTFTNLCVPPAQGVGAAAAVQCANAAIAMAIAEGQLRANGAPVRRPEAGNAVDPCVFATTGWLSCDDDPDDLVGVVSTNQLVFNSNPTKLGVESIRSAAKKLAAMELQEEAISLRMASANHMLTAMCRSVSGGWEIDVRTPHPDGPFTLRSHGT